MRIMCSEYSSDDFQASNFSHSKFQKATFKRLADIGTVDLADDRIVRRHLETFNLKGPSAWMVKVK